MDHVALFIDDLIDEIRKDGWEIISPEIAYNDGISTYEPATLMTKQGRIMAHAIDHGYPGPFRRPSENMKYWELLFKNPSMYNE